MKNLQNNAIDVSVLVPICERYDDLKKLFYSHHKILDCRNLTHEFIFVLDGDFPDAKRQLNELKKELPELVKIVQFNRTFGEAIALTVAFAQSTGKLCLTLASYVQIQAEEINKLFDALDDKVDIIVGNRFPRRDNILNRLQSSIFHKFVKGLSGKPLHDVSCSVRLMQRKVMERIHLYGDLHRFIPILASHKGFRVKELPLLQAPEDIHLRLYRPGVYIRRLLDILTLFFLIKFTQKPLRFFGLLGSAITFFGLVITVITIFQKFFGHSALADRPLFLGGILFLLIGLQTFFIGLVAEIIIFSHMPTTPVYNIEEIVNDETT